MLKYTFALGFCLFFCASRCLLVEPFVYGLSSWKGILYILMLSHISYISYISYVSYMNTFHRQGNSYKLSSLWIVIIITMKCHMSMNFNCNVGTMKCNVYELLSLWNVMSMNCWVYEMSVYELSVYKLSVYELSCLWIVCLWVVVFRNHPCVYNNLCEMSCLWNVLSLMGGVYDLSWL